MTSWRSTYSKKPKSQSNNEDVIELSDDCITKQYEKCNFEDAQLAASKAISLGLRVPCIKRVLEVNGLIECVKMCIHGQTLMDVWHQLASFQPFGSHFNSGEWCAA